MGSIVSNPSVRPSRVQIYSINLDDHAGALLEYDRDNRILSAGERQRAERLSTPLLSRRFLCGHIALRLVLAKFANLKSFTQEFSRSASGKPRIASSPVQFSYSDSGAFAAIAVHDRYPVGLDIETKSPEKFRNKQLESLAANLPWIGKNEPRARYSPGQAGWVLLEAWVKLHDGRLATALDNIKGTTAQIADDLQANNTLSAARFDLPGNGFGICCCRDATVEYEIGTLNATSLKRVRNLL